MTNISSLVAEVCIIRNTKTLIDTAPPVMMSNHTSADLHQEQIDA
jgi:hypothetical protein